MKYWKKFWNNLNLGWKRLHYVILIIVGVTSTAAIVDNSPHFPTPHPLWGILTYLFFMLLFVIGYILLLSIIFWIKEGFEKTK